MVNCRLDPGENSPSQRAVSLQGSDVAAPVPFEKEARNRGLPFGEAAVERDQPSAGMQKLCGVEEEFSRLAVIQVMENSEGDARIEFPEAGQNGGIVQIAAHECAPPRILSFCAFDVFFADVDSTIESRGREKVEEGSGAAAEIEQAGIRFERGMAREALFFGLGGADPVLEPGEASRILEKGSDLRFQHHRRCILDVGKYSCIYTNHINNRFLASSSSR